MRCGSSRWAGMAPRTVLRGLALLATLGPSISFTSLPAAGPCARAGRRLALRQPTALAGRRGSGGGGRLSMQAQEGMQGVSFVDGAARPSARWGPGGPLASNDAPSFLRLVRTGERWFELQTAVVSYTAPPGEQVRSR